MIKKRHLIILLSVVIAGLLIWWFLLGTTDNTQTTQLPTPTGQQKPVMLNGRRVLNVQEARQDVKDIKVSNKVSEHWAQAVEAALKVQGGDDLKDIRIEKVESLIWIQHGVALNVESIKITIKNEKGEKTIFRAMVDSQNGKILQTWDQPITDPMNPREKFGIKVDPRYFENN